MTRQFIDAPDHDGFYQATGDIDNPREWICHEECQACLVEQLAEEYVEVKAQRARGIRPELSQPAQAVIHAKQLFWLAMTLAAVAIAIILVTEVIDHMNWVDSIARGEVAP